MFSNFPLRPPLLLFQRLLEKTIHIPMSVAYETSIDAVVCHLEEAMLSACLADELRRLRRGARLSGKEAAKVHERSVELRRV